MNVNDLLNVANLIPRKGIVLDRLERVKREGSPIYTWNVPATAAGATAKIRVPDQFPDSRKYEPLDSLEIVNNESVIDLLLTINDNETRAVPAGTIRTIKGTGIALWTIAVANQHASATSTLYKIVCTLQREPMTIDKWAQRQ